MVGAFAPLKEICPDRATPELMELTARLGSMLPYRQAAKVLADFLPTEPTETHATARKRSIRIGKRLDDQVMPQTWRARSQTDDRCQLEMQLPGDRRKEFVISIDTAHVRSADQHSARNFELVVARCGRGGRGERGGRYFVTGSTDQQAIRDRALHSLQEVGYRGIGDVTVISDGAEILKRLPGAMPKPTTHIIDWFHIAMKIQPMQQIADHIVRSRSGPFEALPTIDRDIRAVKWRLWHGRVGRAIRDLEQLLALLWQNRFVLKSFTDALPTMWAPLRRRPKDEIDDGVTYGGHGWLRRRSVELMQPPKIKRPSVARPRLAGIFRIRCSPNKVGGRFDTPSALRVLEADSKARSSVSLVSIGAAGRP
ncbi:hypothetical protein IVB23_14325 [Bradyrhizobium sp. 191]|nr:hypothetical protein IVB23_14325 [Bradyrhizobium sp. 191]